MTDQHPPPDFRTLRLDIDGPVATVTLDRPDRMNAFTPRMAAELVAAFDLTDADDSVRSVIVTGEGRAFCAGADLAAGADSFDPDAVAHQQIVANARPPGHGLPAFPEPVDGIRRDLGGWVTLRIFDSLKPVIAAVNGAAAGIGATMTLPMDVRMAARGARFGFVFAARGIVPEAASSWFLPRVVGINTAMEWCATSRLVPAEEAAAAGLIGHLHEPDDLGPAARALALAIAENSAPVSVALARRLLWTGLGDSHPFPSHLRESKLVPWCGSRPDAAEGIAAFLDKRPASWTQRVSEDLPEAPW